MIAKASPESAPYWRSVTPAVPATPGNDAFEGQTVRQITFDPIAQPLEQSIIDNLIPFHPGQPYHADQAASAIGNGIVAPGNVSCTVGTSGVSGPSLERSKA